MITMRELANSSYMLLLILRFVLTFWPQTGYIHPDEFFQSPEVVYGDVFGLSAFKTWEFTSKAPIRSITFPYITVGIPALLIKSLGGMSLIGTRFLPYLMLVLPRLIMCCISLIHDYCIYKLFKLMNKDPFPSLAIFASSYVSLVYFTRTFSNTLEAACFTYLNYLVAREIINQKNAVAQDDKNYFIYGVIISVGSFIRPTFFMFSIVPMMFFVLFCSNNKFQIIMKCIHSAMGGVATALLLAMLDTAYYTKDFSGLINPLNITNSIRDLIFTPLNFVLYNIDRKRLLQHGYHPWYLHLLVNIPLTFSSLGMYGFWNTFEILIIAYKRTNQNISALRVFMLLSFLVPICLLSLVPHQEPRFLITFIFPLVCLCANRLFEHCYNFRFTSFMWILTNAMGLMFFGFFHQGGMYPTLSYFHTMTTRTSPPAQNIVFYRTYMPPRHLLALNQSLTNTRIHDFAGASDSLALSAIQSILQTSSPGNKSYLIVPSSVTIPIVNMNILLSPTHQLKLEKKFFPHLSIEDMPLLYNIWNVAISKSSFSYKMRKMKDFFCLNIYRVERNLKS